MTTFLIEKIKIFRGKQMDIDNKLPAEIAEKCAAFRLKGLDFN